VREIAYELSQEHDAEKIIALGIELNRAFEDQEQMEKGATPISQPKSDGVLTFTGGRYVQSESTTAKPRLAAMRGILPLGWHRNVHARPTCQSRFQVAI